MALLVLLTCAQGLQLGCKHEPEISFEAPSPTREFNASVEIWNNGGQESPGVNVTYVYLHRATQPKLPILILLGGPPQTEPVLRWITPTQLEISHHAQQTISFQAVQFDRVMIAVTTFGKVTSAKQ